MRRFLLATAAVAALALAAPLAGAQYPESTSSNPVYSSPSDPAMDDEQTAVPNATPPVDSQTSATPYSQYDNPSPEMNTNTTPYAQQTQSSGPYAQPAQPYADAQQGQNTTQQGQYATQQSAPMPAQSGATDQGQYASSETYAHSADQSMSPTMIEYAQEAGMAGVPMSAAEVCAPRDVSLAQGTSRLNSATRQQLRFAADRASACDVQRVVIQAPDGRGAAVRQTLVEHGFDDAEIEVVRGSELGVEMTFAGVAFSSAEYAAMFNAPQYASAGQVAPQPSSYPATAPSSGYQPTSYNANPSPSYSAPAATSASSYNSTPSPAPAHADTGSMTEDHENHEEMTTENPRY
ncbi:MAG: hypothetical protein H7124_18350 [Phycisphaerales bacterium]|nr:hypothetical protein [Hyphomonadaceae bacterium]